MLTALLIIHNLAITTPRHATAQPPRPQPPRTTALSTRQTHRVRPPPRLVHTHHTQHAEYNGHTHTTHAHNAPHTHTPTPPRTRPTQPRRTTRPRLLASADEPRPAPAKLAACAALGALLAASLAGGAVAPPAARALQLVALAWPLFSARRLWRDGRRRAALLAVLSAAARRFCTRWWQYCTIPLFAGAVGWLTNKVAVDMIFYPVEFGGLRLRTYPDQPLGWIGWQGIVPAKARMMAQRITDLVTSQLIDVRECFGRLEPGEVAARLGPGVDTIAETIAAELVPARAAGAATAAGRAALRGLDASDAAELAALRTRFVAGLTRDMQQHVTELVDLDEVVVGGMVREKQLLIDLFRRCGREEFRFLVNSGFGFGCALGVLQMLLWLFYEKPWTLAIGGAVVGYLTNWIALKLIFEPVEPTRVGPFVLQGLFLRRQQEVSADFAESMTEKLLTSESLWQNILEGKGSARFAELLHARTAQFAGGVAAVLYGGTRPTEFAGDAWWGRLVSRASGRVMQLLPTELGRVHPYIDETLALKPTLKDNLRGLSTPEFEQLLHPIFQEDELTLILVGSVLGLAVGYAQAVWDAKSRGGAPSTDPGGGGGSPGDKAME